jgi:hypothetical protein
LRAAQRISQQGLVSIFYSSAARTQSKNLSPDQADLHFVGESSGSWLGYAIGDIFTPNTNPQQRLLLLGAPRYQTSKNENLGRMYAYNLTCLSSSPSSTSACLVFSITGSDPNDQGKSRHIHTHTHTHTHTHKYECMREQRLDCVYEGLLFALIRFVLFVSRHGLFIRYL